MKGPDGPSGVFSAPEVGFEEAPEGQAQRVRVIQTISLAGVGVTILYIGVYALMSWWSIAAYSAVFAVWYGATYYACACGHIRGAGIGLIGGGTLHLVGIAILFLTPLGGTQIFIAVLPVFALISISPRDRLWTLGYTLVAVGVLIFLEVYRDTYVPVLDVEMNSALFGPMRAMAVAIFVLMVVGVFNAFLGDLREARKRLAIAHLQSETLLLNILPVSIAERLKRQQETIADDYDEATVLFADLVGFTTLASTQSASETVTMLNAIVSTFDVACVAHGLEKIKTIGDAYMAAAGVPTADRDHALQALRFALDMQALLDVYNRRTGRDLQLRIGISSGPVTAGVIGARKFTYDLWGDTVNIASRMESTGVAGRIQVTEAVAQATADHFTFEDRGMIDVKGKGQMHTYLLVPPE